MLGDSTQVNVEVKTPRFDDSKELYDSLDMNKLLIEKLHEIFA